LPLPLHPRTQEWPSTTKTKLPTRIRTAINRNVHAEPHGAGHHRRPITEPTALTSKTPDPKETAAKPQTDAAVEVDADAGVQIVQTQAKMPPTQHRKAEIVIPFSFRRQSEHVQS
jgi:hypothetical protein